LFFVQYFLAGYGTKRLNLDIAKEAKEAKEILQCSPEGMHDHLKSIVERKDLSTEQKIEIFKTLDRRCYIDIAWYGPPALLSALKSKDILVASYIIQRSNKDHQSRHGIPGKFPNTAKEGAFVKDQIEHKDNRDAKQLLNEINHNIRHQEPKSQSPKRLPYDLSDLTYGP